METATAQRIPRKRDRLALDMSEQDRRRVIALAGLAPGLLSQHGVARRALRLGLAMLECDPTQLLGDAEDGEDGRTG